MPGYDYKGHKRNIDALLADMKENPERYEFGFPTLETDMSDILPRCTTCGDEGTIEIAPDPRYPWVTKDIPCPDCTSQDEIDAYADRMAERRADR
jgi:hypothetical protein